jgi:riboflavin kinase
MMMQMPAYVSTLIELYALGASDHSVEISTSDLGKRLGLSQQAISKHLLQLEDKEMIERKKAGRRNAVIVTSKGSDEVLAYYTRMKSAIEGKTRNITFHGKVFSGLGEGAYYISVDGYKKQFMSLLGFRPYPGTLNLALDSSETEIRKQLKFLDAVEIKGFRDGKRTYGPVKCFHAKVDDRYEAGALEIERTHHGAAVLEVISPLHLRRVLSLKEGDPVSVTVYPGS